MDQSTSIMEEGGGSFSCKKKNLKYLLDNLFALILICCTVQDKFKASLVIIIISHQFFVQTSSSCSG